GDGEHADDGGAVGELDPLDAGGRAAHVADVVLREADGHAVGGDEQEVVGAGGQADAEQGVVLAEADGDDAGAVDVGVGLEGGAFDDAVAGDEGEVVAAGLEVLDGQVGAGALAGAEVDEVDDGPALAGAAHLGQLVD